MVQSMKPQLFRSIMNFEIDKFFVNRSASIVFLFEFATINTCHYSVNSISRYICRYTWYTQKNNYLSTPTVFKQLDYLYKLLLEIQFSVVDLLVVHIAKVSFDIASDKLIELCFFQR